jgi:uracil-DNA glycosylase
VTADALAMIRARITDDPSNAWAKEAGYAPLYTAAPGARIAVIGQAPGRRAQESGIPWDDPSGVKLREWLGVTNEQFYDPDLIALLPMDFYFPGKQSPGKGAGKSGDLPPRKEFAPMWHPLILEQLPDLALTILIGGYAQKHYLAGKLSLTETVRGRADYLPTYFPIVHPSPLNFRWQAKNPWFEAEVIPELQRLVRAAL